MSELLISDNIFRRTWVDKSVKFLPKTSWHGSRMYIPTERAIYKFDGDKWNLKECNKSPMKVLEIMILDSGKTDWI